MLAGARQIEKRFTGKKGRLAGAWQRQAQGKRAENAARAKTQVWALPAAEFELTRKRRLEHK
jgi:hypothetical protein